jgi:phosphatidylinositol glycan class Z
MFSAISYFSEMLANDWRHKPSVINVYAMTMFTFVSALGFLSLIPHQEPRFLIPLTVPIVLMNAHKLRWKSPGKWKPLLTLWYIFNIFFVIFYGFVHQVTYIKYL